MWVLIAVAVILPFLFGSSQYALSAGNCTVFRSWNTGDALSASDLNSSFTQAAVTNGTLACTDDISATVAAMQATTDPYPASSESLATTAQGEIERIRYTLKTVFGWTQWYTHGADIAFGASRKITTGQWHAGLIFPPHGGLGFDARSAANGSLPIGNGSGFTLATVTAGTGISVANGAWSITVSSTIIPPIILTPVAATFPAANFPQLVKNAGTNWVDYTLDYDTTTEEAAYWYVAIPNGTTVTSAAIDIFSRQGSLNAGTAGWKVTTITRANGEAWDTAGTTDTLTAATVPGTAGMVQKITATLTSTGWAADEVVLVKIARDTGNDTVAEDVKFISAVLRIN